ncbi:glycosyltransferase involved in cell wall biosynthesis [Stenotrophomonas rhizophila]|uniref:Glycosyltransferase involved in cell wall biosynthesis n=1 Tax=Stenotrophomonas rhizophila TaxID=216778 RepID=A0AAP5AH07_9GAMM|nr:glycosyltransferase [Stenotrophomonas rhizophila]MDQ1107235.1 glycosyltransferase involved in cell wall biosynthesis [Stenotrophomonas rhizophila]
MKILYTNFHAGDGGGHTTYLASLARALSPRHQLFMAAPAGSRVLRVVRQERIAEPVEIAFSSGLATLGRQWADLRTLRGLIVKHGIDIVHANGARDHRVVMEAVAGLPKRPKLVFTKHNSKSSNTFGNAVRARWGTDRVIAVSEHTRQMLLDSPYRRCPIDVVRNGVDLQRFSPVAPADGAALRARWTLDPDALVLVSNAGTDGHKGWIDLARAIATLPEPLRGKVHMAVAGREPDPLLVAEVEQLGVAGQVHFAGLLEDIRPFVASGDAGFVLSYDVETISFACREMMAMGKPVMVSDYAGLPENITHGHNGWIVPVRNVAAIAAQVVALYELRQTLPAVGQAARAHAVEAFGLETFSALTEACYVAVLGGAAD